MRLRAILILGLALALGAAAVFLTRTWIATQLASRVPLTASTPAPALATIVVAATPLRFGAKIAPSSIKAIAWPENAIPPGSFRTVAELIGPQPRVVLQPMEANEPVLAGKITGPGGRATLSAIIEQGKKAVTFRVNDVLGVAGYVLPGDRVDVMLTRDFANGGGLSTDVLMQNLKVLGIDQLADQKADQPIVAKAVTFEVSTDEAQKLTLASQVGALSLALRGVLTQDAAKVRRIAIDDLDIGPVDVPPPPPPVSLRPAARPAAPIATIGVTRGLDRMVYPVLPGGVVNMPTPLTPPAPQLMPEEPPPPAQNGPPPTNASPGAQRPPAAQPGSPPGPGQMAPARVSS